MSDTPAPSIGDTAPCDYHDCAGTMTLEVQRLQPRRSFSPGARAGSTRRVVVWQCDAKGHHRREERGVRPDG